MENYATILLWLLRFHLMGLDDAYCAAILTNVDKE